MKLKDGFVIRTVAGQPIAVATGTAARDFHGMVRNNETADFIFRQLQTDTTEEQIVSTMLQEYDAPRERIAADVHQVIAQLRDAGLLVE